MFPQDVEISDDVFLIQREVAEAYKSADGNPIQVAGGPPVAVAPSAPRLPLGGGGMPEPEVSTTGESGAPSATSILRLVWSGDVPHQKWMNFYTKVLSKFAATLQPA